MDMRQVQFAVCVVAMVMLKMSGDSMLFSIAMAVALVNFISSRLLCVFGRTCTLDSEVPQRDLNLTLSNTNRITGLMGDGPEWLSLKLKSPVTASIAWQYHCSCSGSGDCFVPRNDDYFCLSKCHLEWFPIKKFPTWLSGQSPA